MSKVASKAAPKTLNQFKNFTYVVVAWLGFNRGFQEKSTNDALWVQYQQKVRNENAGRLQSQQAKKDEGKASAEAPALIQEMGNEAAELFKELRKTIQ
ncbi:hypothetical protein STCU_10723 [Strigomonas culicis]|uniref:Uncharacterized protein n=1 Tax=Strigomonas culicis TaxID=28005 RepID=S9V351_9TRYP|nr:hypothetical protein STCU_10723 [Strigomonas culicis]|eukprot:EPY17255.1 hypothetical protein STCU_10723 [Strigomonas culicis]